MPHYKYGTIGEESPLFANYLLNKQDEQIHIGSAKKVDWICPSCGKIVYGKSVNKVISRKSIPCNICNDGVSRPEKIVASALSQIGVKYVSQKTFEWSRRKRYDFYLPDYNSIIEVHGAQHYGFGFKNLSGVSLETQQENDKEKEAIAKENGICAYFIINASNTLSTNIIAQLSSVLLQLGITAIILPSSCEKEIMESKIAQAAKLWNLGLMSGEISKTIGVQVNSVIKYLKIASAAGMCEYDVYTAHIKSQQYALSKLKRKVICTTTGEVFDSLASAKRKYNISSSSNIIRACNDKSKHAGELNGVKLSWEYCK